jgi:hypothetical protein
MVSNAFWCDPFYGVVMTAADDPRRWELSAIGEIVENGQVIARPPSYALHPGRAPRWLADAEEICDAHNAKLDMAVVLAVLRDRLAEMEALTDPPASTATQTSAPSHEDVGQGGSGELIAEIDRFLAAEEGPNDDDNAYTLLERCRAALAPKP